MFLFFHVSPPVHTECSGKHNECNNFAYIQETKEPGSFQKIFDEMYDLNIPESDSQLKTVQNGY